MKSKWLNFLLLEQGEKTDKWRVESKSGDVLGIIVWYSPWRQYCFHPADDTIYAQSCLRDISEFIKKQMDARKK
ncbi:MAG: hypothetical protein ACFFAU_01515 [Candidatus Hodarchaeota archaeon]